MTDKSAGRKAPTGRHTIIGHAPFHRAFEIGHCLRGQFVDPLGDTALRLR